MSSFSPNKDYTVLTKKHIILGSHNTKTMEIEMIITTTHYKTSFVLVYPLIQENK